MTFLQITFGTPEFDEAVALRHEVLRKPLGMQYTPEQLAAEYDQIHLAVYSDAGPMIGYLNMTPLDAETVKMRQVAVAPSLQRQGVGRRMVAWFEEVARDKGFKKIVLHARETAVPFYLALGYTITGDRFEEVGIPHVKMYRNL